MPPGGELVPTTPGQLQEWNETLPRVKPFDPLAPVRTIRYSGEMAWCG
jgi:hypothetical protein